jgi:transposase
VAKPIDYLLKHWDRFAYFAGDGSVCLTNNAAERALRGFNGIDPLAWLADALAHIAAIPQSRLHELLPWAWKSHELRSAA